MKIEPATGAPVTALRRAFWPGKRLRPQGCGEARWYHESFKLSSLSGNVRQDEGFFRRYQSGKEEYQPMSEHNTFYITTPIYYPSDKLHIGHSYTTVALRRTGTLQAHAGLRRHVPDRHRRARPENFQDKDADAGVTPRSMWTRS